MKKYVAFRIDTSSIKNHKVVKGYFVRGQRNTDYNWDMLGEFDSMDSAKHYIKSICTDPITQRIYGPDGYGIRL
jgi:hypothetical protein